MLDISLTRSLTHGIVIALLAGALACSRNRDETGTAVVDTSRVWVDSAGDTAVQNPPGYRGMERDTSMVPPHRQQPVDTFLQHQGVDPRGDTAGYSGAERDTTGAGRRDSIRADTAVTDSVVTDSAGQQDSIGR